MENARRNDMRSLSIIVVIVILFGLSSCGLGGSNVPADTEVEVQLTVSELRNFDEDARKNDMGKVGVVIGKVISSKRVAPNEKEMGSHFIHIYAEKGPNEQFDPQISCYTWGNPNLKPGDIVELKGNIGRGAAMGHSLLNCSVVKK